MPDLLSEAELAVLGCVLITSGKIIDELEPLTGDDFYEPKRGDLYEAMRSLWADGRPVEAFTLSEARPEDAAFVFSLTSTHATPSSAAYYGDIVRKYALRRRLAAAGSSLAGLGVGMDPAEIADQARMIIDDAIGNTGRKPRLVKDILPGLLERMTTDKVFVPSPWPSLNEKIGGFRPGAVYVVAARPGDGKTVLAGQIAALLAEEGFVAFSSLEMTEEELVARLVSERLLINVGHVKDARMNEFDWRRFHAGRARLEDMRIAIDDSSGVSGAEVRAFATSVSRTLGPLSGVVVDYMQLMVAREKMDRHLQVADFSRRLKIMAKDMQVPVIALSQLNRNSVSSALAVPKLSDLRESGAIEQDADCVFLLRREGEFPNEELVIDVAKNRHGETGEIRLRWEGAYSRAVEWNHRDSAEDS